MLGRLADDKNDDLRFRALFNLGLAHLKPALAAPAGQDNGELDSALAVYKNALLLRPDDLDAKWNYELALRKKQGGGGGGGGGGGSNKSPQGQAPQPQGGLGQQQAEQLLGSAAREERDVQSKKQKQNQSRAAAGRKGLVIGALALIAQLSIVAHAPDVASACDAIEVSVAVSAPGQRSGAMIVPSFAPFDVLRSPPVPHVTLRFARRRHVIAEYRYVITTDHIGTFTIRAVRGEAGTSVARSRPMQIAMRPSARQVECSDRRRARTRRHQSRRQLSGA